MVIYGGWKMVIYGGWKMVIYGGWKAAAPYSPHTAPIRLHRHAADVWGLLWRGGFLTSLISLNLNPKETAAGKPPPHTASIQPPYVCTDMRQTYGGCYGEAVF